MLKKILIIAAALIMVSFVPASALLGDNVVPSVNATVSTSSTPTVSTSSTPTVSTSSTPTVSTSSTPTVSTTTTPTVSTTTTPTVSTTTTPTVSTTTTPTVSTTTTPTVSTTTTPTVSTVISNTTGSVINSLPIGTVSNQTSKNLNKITNTTISNAPIATNITSSSLTNSTVGTLSFSFSNATSLSTKTTQTVPNTLSSQEIASLNNLQLSATYVTPPTLNSSTLSLWMNSFSAKISGTVSKIINNASELPAVIVAGKLNTTAISAAESTQSSILVNLSFPTLTNGTDIVSAIKMPNYTLPNTTTVVSVIPTVVTPVNPTSGQFIATPPLNIVPGQEMIISVANSTIPSFGGLWQLDIQSSPNATSNGGSQEEWLTAQVDNKIPSSISSDGIDGTIFLFINIQYPYDDTGIGFNWGNPANHAKPPTMTLLVNKTSDIGIQNDSNGCPVVDAYTLSLGAWTSNGLGEIYSSSVSPTQCEIKIQSQHLSKFAFSMRHIGTVKPTGSGQFGIGHVVDDSGPINWQGYMDNAAAYSVIGAPSQQIPVSSFANNIATSSSVVHNSDSNVVSSPGFSNISCARGPGYVLMTGLYTSETDSYKVAFLQMSLLDSQGRLMATGNGVMSHVLVNTPTFFSAVVRTDSNFASCTVQIDSSISK